MMILRGRYLVLVGSPLEIGINIENVFVSSESN